MKIFKEKNILNKYFKKFNTEIENSFFSLNVISEHDKGPKAIKILSEDFDNIKKYNVIYETVFRNIIFEQFYNLLKKNSLTNTNISFKTSELENYFPKSWIITRYLKQSNPNTHFLYISILNDFKNKEELLNHLNFWKFEEFKIDDETFLKIYNEIQNSRAEFFEFNTNKYSLMILKKDFTIDDIRHEFGHYINWLKDKEERFESNVASFLNIGEENFKGLEYFLKIFKCSLDSLNYMMREGEYETLLNDFLNSLKDIKSKYYSNLSNYEFAKFISENLLLTSDKYTSVINYLEEIQKLPFFNDIKNKIEFKFILYHNILGVKITNIKNHIFGFFGKTFKGY